eukprot:3512540-Alexandrium_andersonii.AAC.1
MEAQFRERVEREGRAKPYICPSLRCRGKYLEFLEQLAGGHMLGITAHKKALVTPFSVKNKNGRIRLVLDARG